MALMENVKRIKEAKAALKTAIKDKGVSVPDDALLSEYPALVEKIDVADELAPIYEAVFDVRTKGMTNFSNLFEGYKGEDLTGVRKLDTSKVKNFNGTFSKCSEITELDLSAWDMSSAEDVSWMFYNTYKLTKLNISTWKLPKIVKSTSYMFSSCGVDNLDCLKNWDVSKITKMENMINSCKNLKSLDLSSWDVGNVIKFGSFCTFCSALEDFKAPKNIKVSISFDYTKLNYESLMSIINNLAPVETTQTLTLGNLLNKLSTEEIAIATQKGWTVR